MKRLYSLWTYKEALTKNMGLGSDLILGESSSLFLSTYSRGRERSSASTEREDKVYDFVDILLPARHQAEGEGGVESQIVVCHGPLERHAKAGEREVFRDQVTAEEAIKAGLLQTFDLQTLVKHAQSFGSASQAVSS